jgi:hypothetical protein
LYIDILDGRYINLDSGIKDDPMIMADDWVMECRCGSPLCRKIIGPVH